MIQSYHPINVYFRIALSVFARRILKHLTITSAIEFVVYPLCILVNASVDTWELCVSTPVPCAHYAHGMHGQKFRQDKWTSGVALKSRIKGGIGWRNCYHELEILVLNISLICI